MSFVSKILTFVLLIAVPLAKAAILPNFVPKTGIAFNDYKTKLDAVNQDGNVAILTVNVSALGSPTAAEISTAINTITYITHTQKTELVLNTALLDPVGLEAKINDLLALKKDADAHLANYVIKLADVQTFLNKGTPVVSSKTWKESIEKCLNSDPKTSTSNPKLTELSTLLPFVATFVTKSNASVDATATQADKDNAFDEAFDAAKILLESEEKWKAFYKANGIVYSTPSTPFPVTIQKHLNDEYLKFKAAYEGVVRETNGIFVDADVKTSVPAKVTALGKIFTSGDGLLLKVYKFGKYTAEQTKLTDLEFKSTGPLVDLKALVIADPPGAKLRFDMSGKLKAIKLIVDGVFSANGWVADPTDPKFEEIIEGTPLIKMKLYTNIKAHLLNIQTEAKVTGEFNFSTIAASTKIKDAAAGISAVFGLKTNEKLFDDLIDAAKNIGTEYGAWVLNNHSKGDKDLYNHFRKSVRDFIKAANEYFSKDLAVFNVTLTGMDESIVQDLKFETDGMLKAIITKYDPVIKAINGLTTASIPSSLVAPAAWASINPTTCANSKEMLAPIAGGKSLLDLLDEGIKTEAGNLAAAIGGFIAAGDKNQLLAVHFAAFTFVEKCSLLMNNVYNSEPTFLDTPNEHKLTTATHPVTIFHGFLATKLNELIAKLNLITDSTTISANITNISTLSSDLTGILGLTIGAGITMPTELSGLVTPSTGILTKAHASIAGPPPPVIEDIFKYKQVILGMSKKEICCDLLTTLYPSLTCVAITKQTSDFETLLNVEIKAIVGATNELTTKVNALSSASPTTSLNTDILNIENSMKASSGLKTLRDCPSYSVQIKEFDKLFAATTGQIAVLKANLTESINDIGLLYKLNKSLEDLIVAIKSIITAVYGVKTIGTFLLGTNPDFTLVGVTGTKVAPTHSPVIVAAEVSYTSYHGIYGKLVVSANKIGDEAINAQLKGELTAILEELINFNLDVKSFTGADTTNSVVYNNVVGLKTQAESIKNSINGTPALTIPPGSSLEKEVVSAIKKLGNDAAQAWEALLDASNSGVTSKTFSKVTVTVTPKELVTTTKKDKIAGIFKSSNDLLLAAKDLLEGKNSTAAASEVTAKIGALKGLLNALKVPEISGVASEVLKVTNALTALGNSQSATSTPEGKETFKSNANAVATAVKSLALVVLGVEKIPNDINPQLTEEVTFTLTVDNTPQTSPKLYSEGEWIGIYQILSGKLSALVTGLSNFDANKVEIKKNIKEIEEYEIYPFTTDSNGIKPKLIGLISKFKSDVAKHFSDNITPEKIMELKASIITFINGDLEGVIEKILVNFTNKTFHTKINTELLKPVDSPKKDEKGALVAAVVPDDAGENQNVTKFKDAMDKFRPNFNAIKAEIRKLTKDSKPEEIDSLVEKTKTLISDLETSCENKEDEEFIKFKAKLDACSSSLKEFKEATTEGKEAALAKLKDAVTSVESSIEDFEKKHLEFMGKFKLSAMAITFIVIGAVGGMLVVVVVIYLVTKNRGAPETEVKEDQVVGSSKV